MDDYVLQYIIDHDQSVHVKAKKLQVTLLGFLSFVIFIMVRYWYMLHTFG